MRDYNDQWIEGEMFCAFIALIVRSHIGVKLEELLQEKEWSMAAMAEMEKIRVIAGSKVNKPPDPVTKNQRLILEQFGLDQQDLERYLKGD